MKNLSIVKAPFVWLDMEMTGLDPEQDSVLEIAAVCTNEKLEITSPEFHMILNVPETILSSMNEWCKKTHTASGLCDAVRSSIITKTEATIELQNFLVTYAISRPLLCGNTIWQDRIFLRTHFPAIENLFHYRMVDVSSIKELVQKWYPGNPHALIKKSDAHRALQDIHESIAELRTYKEHFFVT